MKFKILTKEQIIISLDRLTRFKNTKEKYLRVYSDILVSSLIEPKLKKTDFEKKDFVILTEWVTEIVNVSIDKISADTNLISTDNEWVQDFLRNYENSVFVNDDETQKLLNNHINFNKAINLIPNDCSINLRWLRSIIKNERAEKSDLKEIRSKHLLKYPIEKVLLVEGITEEILLPVFSKFLGYDFYAEGVQIIPAGGKNQVVKMYYKLAEELKIPIFLLLDRDAEENIKQIMPRLRNIDKIHLVSCGEFEDLLPKSLIIKTVNSHFKNFLSISEQDFSGDLATVKILEEIFKTKGLHEFKKAEFAKLVSAEIVSNTDISDEIKAIIEEIKFINKTLDTNFCS